MRKWSGIAALSVFSVLVLVLKLLWASFTSGYAVNSFSSRGLFNNCF